MTPRSHLASQVLRAIRVLEEIAAKVDPALEHCQRQADAIDGYSAGSDAPKVSHTSELTPTEAAAEARLHWGYVGADIRATHHALIVCADDLLDLLHKALRGAIDIPKPRECDSSGRQGAIEWADPTCRDADTKDGLCAKCYMRERRWRMEHKLPTRKSIQPAAA